MNLRIRLAIFAMIALTACLCSLPQATLAHHGRDCKEAKGNLSVVNPNTGTTSGRITQGGKLNGTTQAVFTSGFTSTPEPATFSYTDDFTVTTNRGVLRTHNIGIFDTVTGLFTEIARIDPATSTRDFAGATGVLYINGNTTDGGASFRAEISGEICFED